MQLFVISLYLHHSFYVLFHICRFSAEEKVKHHPCALLPFGYGPRNCIGMRFALLQVKMALIELLTLYRMELTAETKVLCSPLSTT